MTKRKPKTNRPKPTKSQTKAARNARNAANRQRRANKAAELAASQAEKESGGVFTRPEEITEDKRLVHEIEKFGGVSAATRERLICRLYAMSLNAMDAEDGVDMELIDKTCTQIARFEKLNLDWRKQLHEENNPKGGENTGPLVQINVREAAMALIHDPEYQEYQRQRTLAADTRDIRESGAAKMANGTALALIDREITNHVLGRTPETILILEEPPRHGKTEYVGKILPAWYTHVHPDRQIIMASATASLAALSGRTVRGIVQRYGPQYGVHLDETRTAADDWATTEGGGMKTAGVAGDVMGRDGHLLICDDYLRNAEAALSETIRDKQWDWWESTFTTRLEPGGRIIVMATRWHKDDLIGRILAKAESGEGMLVRRIRLPAMAEANDPLGRAVGAALWPERWPLGDGVTETINAFGDRVVGLAMRKRISDGYWWAALYQQRPTQHGRAEWPDAYFGPHIWAEVWPSSFECSTIAVDPSKGKGQGDPSAIVFAGLCGGLVYVDADIRHRPANQIVTDTIRMAQRYLPDGISLEANAFQELLGGEFNRQTTKHEIAPLPLYQVTNTVNKELRIGRLGPPLGWETNGVVTGKIRLRRNSPGCRVLLDQMQEWPLGDHDDGPDALEMALRLLKQLSGLQIAAVDPERVVA